MYSVLESIINEKLKQLTTTLRNIHSISSIARNTASRLSALTDYTQQQVTIY